MHPPPPREISTLFGFPPFHYFSLIFLQHLFYSLQFPALRSSFIVFRTYSRNLMDVQFAPSLSLLPPKYQMYFFDRAIIPLYRSSFSLVATPISIYFSSLLCTSFFCLLAALSAGQWLRITYESSLWFCNVAGRYERTGWGLLEERNIRGRMEHNLSGADRRQLQA